MVLLEEKQHDVDVVREPIIAAARKNSLNASSQGRTKERNTVAIVKALIIPWIGVFTFTQGHKYQKNNEKGVTKVNPISHEAGVELKAPFFTAEQYKQIMALIQDGNA